jgi:hypothetical protein
MLTPSATYNESVDTVNIKEYKSLCP